MTDSFLIFFTNSALAVMVGLTVVYGLRKIQRYSASPEVRQARHGMQSWPRPFPQLSTIIAVLVPFSERFIRPSPRISRELTTIDGATEFNDREFLKMRYVICVLSTCVGTGGFCLAYALGIHHEYTVVVLLPFLFAIGGFLLPRLLLRDRSSAALKRVQRDFPSFLDVFALTLESGQNFQSALVLSVHHLSESESQPGLKTQLQEALRSIRAGQSRMQALQQLSDRLNLPEVVQFSASVAASEKQGVSVTALLRRQAEQLRTSRALAAERHAMKLPVKLLAPLAICIFPCTFLVLAFPIGVQLSRSGIF